MATVTITGNAWTHQGIPVPERMKPELWFRPKAHAWGGSGLLVGVEAQANLDWETGVFSVHVESDAGLFYQPVMRWLLNPEEQKPMNWVWEYAEWPFLVVPGDGGNIAHLINAFPPGTIIAALGPPLASVTNVAWIDLTDQTEEGALVYAPVRG